MRIVDRTTFLALPAGTVFAKYKPCYFEEIEIKSYTCGTDFVANTLNPGRFEGNVDGGDVFEALDRIQAGEPAPPLDFDCYGRDGLFDQDQLFAVFEKRDVEGLIGVLQDALSNGYPDA